MRNYSNLHSNLQLLLKERTSSQSTNNQIFAKANCGANCSYFTEKLFHYLKIKIMLERFKTAAQYKESIELIRINEFSEENFKIIRMLELVEKLKTQKRFKKSERIFYNASIDYLNAITYFEEAFDNIKKN